MKNIMLLLTISCFYNALHAQAIQPNATIVNKFSQLHQSIKPYFKYNKNLHQQTFIEIPAAKNSIDNMPVVTVPITLNFLSNNNNGLDTYQANIDNMYAVKPDSTFVAVMPVKK